MKKYIAFLAFFSFILFIIWEADNNGTHYIFKAAEQIPYKDKVGHFSLYGILALLLDLALKGKNWKLFNSPIPTSIVLVLSFAVIEEITQYWIPARNFDLKDVLADVLGITSFVLIGRFIQPKIKKVYSAFYTPTKKNQEVLK